MTSNLNQSATNKPQIICIDLPGEAVECWRSTDKVKVVLRKHRDVIFDLKLSPGRRYFVESTESDFYHADKKKLVAGKGRQRVSFDDGERLHIWVARDFKGELVLKSEGKLMLKVSLEKLDAKRYDDAPATKPDPVIIALGCPNQPVTQGGISATYTAMHQKDNPSLHARPIAAPTDEDCPVVCVIDGDLKGAPDKIWKILAAGGSRDSGLVEFDPFDVATRNWLLGQLAGGAAYVGDNWEWLKASIDRKTHAGFKLVKARIHYVNGKARFYFSGYSKYNIVFGRGGFAATNERIMSVFSGAGKAGAVVTSTAKAALGTFKANALVAFIFNSATSFAEWKDDVSKDGFDLAGALIMNLVKAVLVAIVVAPVVACILAFVLFVAEGSVAVIAVGVITLGVGVVISYGVDALDKKLGKVVAGEKHEDGLAAILARRMRQNVEHNWNYLVNKYLWNYEEVPF